MAPSPGILRGLLRCTLLGTVGCVKAPTILFVGDFLTQFPPVPAREYERGCYPHLCWS